MHSHRLLPLPLLIGFALIGLLLVITAQSAAATLADSQTTSNIHQPVLTLTLSISTAQSLANQPVLITATLTNATISQTIRNPLYTVRIEHDGHAPILIPESGREQRYISLTPEENTDAHFTFYPLAGGKITLTTHVTVTVDVSPLGSLKIGRSAMPISLIMPSPSEEASIIYETAYQLGCLEENAFTTSTISAGDGWGTFDCALTPGHSFGTRLSRSDSAAAAMDAFNTIRNERALEAFHCHSAYSWSNRPNDGPITYSGHGWTAEHWINISDAQDDTPYGGATGPSEGVYYTMESRNLLPPCTATNLPIAGR